MPPLSRRGDETREDVMKLVRKLLRIGGILLLLIVLLFASLLAALHFLGGGSGAANQSVITMKDVAYGLHPRQKLDIYLPSAAASLPSLGLFVWIHGGTWAGGDKAQYAAQAREVCQWGFACASINYRLNSADAAEPNIHPAQVEDVAAAVDFLADNAARWNIDPNRAIVLGHSSGGHLALLYAYAYDKAKRVRAVAAFAAPTDFTAPEWAAVTDPPLAETIFPRLLGRTKDDDPEGVWRSASPLHRARESPVPTVLVHGRQDRVVPVEQAIRLDAELARLGVPHLLLIEENATHDIKTFDSAALAQFLLRHGKGAE